MPTLNAFDNGDIRATTLVVRMREGKPGGGKGPLISEDRSLTLATANDQTLFIIPIHDKATRYAGKRKLSNGEYAMDGAGNGFGIGEDGDPMNTLTGNDRHSVGTESVVRRLTPIECERLQGFPDNWTEGQSDTNRYKQMGNAVAVPVVEWIIQNICDIV